MNISSIVLFFMVLFLFTANINADVRKFDLYQTDNVLSLRKELKLLKEQYQDGRIPVFEYNADKAEIISAILAYGSEISFLVLKDLKEKDLITEEDYQGKIPTPLIKYQEPEFLSFKELKALYYNHEPEGYLSDKVFRFFRAPIISNQAYFNKIKPFRPVNSRIGPFLRVVSWNVEKSIRMKDAIAIFSSEDELRKRIDFSKMEENQLLGTVLEQRKKLATADIIVLQEMDIGVKRSDYLNAAGELAKTLGMNYAYAPQYLEIDPVLLGLEKIYLENGQLDEEAMKYFVPDKNLYKGVFGGAILSRYPVISVRVFPLKNQGYDWYRGEKEKTTFLEKARRLGSKLAFQNEITREIKVGGRTFFRVDLEVPDIPGNRLTIINIHLEIKCLPEARERQMEEILHYIKDIDHPVIMLGDFNSAPVDLSPTSLTRFIKRTIKKPSNWVSAAISYLSPYGIIINTVKTISNVTKNLHDPLAPHIPAIAPNPVKGMFDRIEKFQFNDGGVFDFRGDSLHSVNGKDGVLANSNQRDLKAFKATYSVKRAIADVIGTFRLDWVFVKAYLKDPREINGTYRFAPHYGETLSELNAALYEKISDHDPNVVDIPFFEATETEWVSEDKSSRTK